MGAQYATGEEWGNKSRKNEGAEPKWKQHLVVDVSGDGRKVWCCKQQYCIGTSNVRSMNQGKLEVIKQEMARVNIDIVGISELKWTRMGEFNSDDHYIYYCGQESLRRNGLAFLVNKRVWNVVLRCSFKNNRMISVYCQGKPFNITVIQVYAPATNTKEAEIERFCEDLQDLLELTPQKRCPSHQGRLECKSRKSRDTWSNRQVLPGSTKRSRAKRLTVLPKECTGHGKHLLPKTQETTLHMDITRWSIQKSDWLYSSQLNMEKLYTLSKVKTGSWLWLRSWTPYCKTQS